MLNNALGCGLRAEGGFLSSSAVQDASQPRSQSAPLSSGASGGPKGIRISSSVQPAVLPLTRGFMDEASAFSLSRALEASPPEHSRRWLQHCMNSHSLWILKLSPECFRSSQDFTIKVSVRRTISALNSSAPRCGITAVIMHFGCRNI